MSLSDLAQRLGYSKSHLSVVETGRVWPSRELLQAYESALDLKSSSLLQLAESLAPLRRSRTPAPYVGPSVEALLIRVAQGVGPRPERAAPEQDEKELPANGSSTRDGTVALEWGRLLASWAATHRSAPLRDEILVVTFRASEVVPTAGDAGQPFKAALQGALENGWSVSHVRWLDGSEEDRFSQFTSLIDFYGFAGNYRPFGLPLSKGLSTPPYGLVAVPGRGALLLMPTRTDRLGHYAVYAGLVFTDPESTSVVWENGAALRDRAEPLATSYERPVTWRSAAVPDVEWLRYSDAETRSVVQPGDRFLVRDGIGTPALLGDARDEGQRSIETSDPAWESFWRTIQGDRILQQAAFRDQVRLHQFREVLTRRGLERFAKGEAGLVDPSILPLSGDQRAAWLQSLVALLRAHPGYEIGLLDETPAWLAPGGGWLVKGAGGDGFVHLETTCRRHDEARQILFELRDPILVQAMREYFLSLWDTLPATNRSKPYVIDVLTQLSQLAQRSS